MSTSRDEIRSWLERAKNLGATHMIVVCDTFDWEDYPVNVMPGEDVRKREKECQRDMQKVMEVYSLTGKYSIEQQLNEGRAFNYD